MSKQRTMPYAERAGMVGGGDTDNKKRTRKEEREATR